MKTPLKYLAIVVLAIMALTWPLIRLSSTEPEAALAETTSIEKEGALGTGDKSEDVDANVAFRRLQLQDENGQIPADAWVNAFQQREAMPLLPEAWCEFTQCGVGGQEIPDWVSIGPGNIGGRIKSIIVHPAYPNPATIWVGAAAGGVWKTTNGGESWSTTTDSIPRMGVTCMAIDPRYPDTLYAGTGGVSGDIPAVGIFKTTDGGGHWGTPLSSTASFGEIHRLAICPMDSQLILTATATGLYRSQNGGVDWVRVMTTLAMSDVDFRPSVPTDVPGIRCISADNGGNAYYSSNGGQTWMPASWSAEPHNGRVELGYSRSDPSIVYAAVGVLGGQIFRSYDDGHNFAFMGNPKDATLRAGPDGFANVLWVDPTNPDTILAGGQYLSRSRDRGIHWEEAGSTVTHQDHHALAEDPRYNGTTNTNGGSTVFDGGDGGIYRTDDILLPCPEPGNCLVWQSRNNMLANNLFYAGAGHAATGTIIGGNHDNGTIRYLGNSEGWDFMRQGDGGFCAVDQSSNPYFYGEHFWLTIYRSTNGGSKAADIYAGIPDAGNGATANTIAPFILDPNDPIGNTMLAGGRRLWRSNNVRAAGLPIFTAIKDPAPANCAGTACSNISAIAVAEGNSNMIWVGYSDGSVYYTLNGTATVPTWVQTTAGLPSSLMCTRIALGPLLPQSEQPGRPVYVTFGGIGSAQGHVWKTTSNGVTWGNISGNLPSIPVYSLVVSRSDVDVLYVGTEMGVFAKAAGSTQWSPGSGGVAHASVQELFWVGSKLVAATFGRSMFTLSPASE